MRARTQRFIAALAVAACAVLLQWISGIPFDRTPGEAFFVAVTLIFALLGATCPFIKDTP
jgi:hypothetical protein